MNWNYLIVGLLGVLVGAAMAIGWGAHRPPRPKSAPWPTTPTMAPVHDPHARATEPVNVGNTSLRHWITYGPSRLGSWPNFVREFYDTLRRDPMVSGYFPDDTTGLQKHFADTVVLVVDKGLSEEGVEAMRAAHADVRDRYGRPITNEVYDRVVTTLAHMLHARQVPGSAIEELATVARTLRPAIVKA